MQPSCPECSTEYVKRVRREGIAERLLSAFYVYPFCCQLCGHRFMFLQRGVRYLRIDEDQRLYERLPADFPVLFASDEVNGNGRVTDISMSGCTIQTETELMPGWLFSMSLRVSSSIPAITVDAAVVRHSRLGRVGVEFLKFQKSEREQLQDFIRSLLFGRPTARRVVVHHPNPAVLAGNDQLSSS